MLVLRSEAIDRHIGERAASLAAVVAAWASTKITALVAGSTSAISLSMVGTVGASATASMAGPSEMNPAC